MQPEPVSSVLWPCTRYDSSKWRGGSGSTSSSHSTRAVPVPGLTWCPIGARSRGRIPDEQLIRSGSKHGARKAHLAPSHLAAESATALPPLLLASLRLGPSSALANREANVGFGQRRGRAWQHSTDTFSAGPLTSGKAATLRTGGGGLRRVCHGTHRAVLLPTAAGGKGGLLADHRGPRRSGLSRRSLVL